MLRLALLVAAAVVLPAAGNKPSEVVSPMNAAPMVSASWAPRFRLPHLPKFNRKHGNEIEVNQMNTRLRNLVVQEEAWFAENKTYGRDANKLAARSPSDTAAQNHVQVQILYAAKTGWTAIASHPDAPGKSCTVFVGYRDKIPLIPRTRTDGTEATMEGIPACDAK